MAVVRYRTCSQLVALATVCLMAAPAPVHADDHRVAITSVIPTFMPAPQPSTLLIGGEGLRSTNRRNPLPAVFIGRTGGQFRRLSVLDASEHAIRVELDALPAGSWQLVVSLKTGFDPNQRPADTDARTDTFSVTFGAAGAQGPSGLAGVQGLTGPVGAIGQAGAAGPVGAAGLAGEPGAVGATGSTGAAGAMGPAGPIGPAGPQGPVGPIGPVGPKGPKGPGY